MTESVSKRSRNPDVVHLTTAHTTRDGRIFYKECVSLAKAGFNVTLIAPGEDGGRVMDVDIRPLRKSPRRLQRMTYDAWRIYGEALRLNAPIYHFHDPELMPVGLALKYHGKTVVYDAHEDLPRQVLSKSWISPWARRSTSVSVQAFEQFAVRHYDAVVAATPAIAANHPQHKTITVNNFPLEDEIHFFGSTARREALTSNAAYVGGMSFPRGIMQVLAALASLPESCSTKLCIVGKFQTRELEAAALASPGWKRVEFLGWRPRQEMIELLSNVAMGIVTFLPAPNHVTAQPNKLFEYMAAGIPVIASDFPLWRQIVVANDCGLLVDPSKPAEIAQAIRWLGDHPKEAIEMGRRGRAAVLDRYNWIREAGKLTDLYRRLMDENRHSRRGTTPIRQSGDCQQGTQAAA